MIYAPNIQVHIQTANGILDVSEDLVSWQLNLRENAVHTFNFKLQNAQRKYDGRLLPMDKITVKLKRINWLQSFSGYLNDGPIFQAWPGTLDITSSCTLKRAQFWYWDPSTVANANMITRALQIKDGGTTPSNSAEGDGGFSRLIQDALTKVINWPASRIHIGKIPNQWFKFAGKVGDLIEADFAMYQELGGSFTAAGTSGSLRVNLPPGSYAGFPLDSGQAHWASAIYNAVRYNMKIADDNIAVMALMCAMTECSLHNWFSPAVPGSEKFTPNDGPHSPDHTSCGLFQQQNNWGTAAERMNPITSTALFVNRLTQVIRGQVHGLGPVSYGQLVQQVQVSAFPDRYQVMEPAASAMVAKMNKLSTGPPGASTDPSFGGTDIGTQNETSTGSMIAKMASDLITAHLPPKSPIIYNLGGDDPDTTAIANVKTLDCSSLVDWAYYQGSGKHLWTTGESRSTVASIYPRCIPISVALASKVQGAALVIGDHHIGVSLGNDTHVAAHDKYSDPRKDCDVSPISQGGGFDRAGLLPHIDYTSSGTTQDAVAQLAKILGKPTKLAPQLSGIAAPGLGSGIAPTTTANDAFASLINLISFNSDQSGIGSALGGNVTLINDEPFLPWLQNAVNCSMRSFCSAPNGDFISWFPDYFGTWNSAGIMNIQLIELQDFTVSWSDQQIVTHQFVLGNAGAGILDQDSAQVGADPSVATDLLNLAKQTAGIATMDYPEIFAAIYGQTADPTYTKAFLTRFGARPDVQQMAYISKGRPEFFMALYLFIQRWAAQFTATVPMTFMPELFPGMLLRVPAFGFQAYVRGVTHQGSYGQSGSFTTNVDICAPTNIASSARTDLLALLPGGGKPLL